MPTPDVFQLIDAFDPHVKAFQTANFSLAEEIEWLDRLRAIRAPVAVILHSSRILEVLAWESLLRAELTDTQYPNKDGPRMNGILRQLKDYDFLPRPTFKLLDSLRNLGNEARHITRKLTFADAEQGYAIALRTLQWYFCEFAKGPSIKCLTIHNQPLDSLLPSDITTLLALLETATVNKQTLLAAIGLERRHCPVLLSPVLASVLVEKLLDADCAVEAQSVLTAALNEFAGDVRLRQLQGLLFSRSGRLKEACDLLEAIEITDSAADEETQGILAGVYKHRAEVEPERHNELLWSCNAKYYRGWRQSHECNTYLGINAAATALWLGQSGQVIPLATTIRDLLETRRLGLAKRVSESPRYLNCWDQLILAESHLLLKEWDKARERYHEAADRFRGQAKVMEVARDQAKKDLIALGESGLIGSIFPG